MQSENRLFEDLSKMLNGMAGTFAGMGREAQDAMRERMKEFAGGMDFVSREEFDAVKQMAATARAEAELLAERVEKLEAALSSKGKTTARRKAAPKAKAAPKRATATKKTAKKATAKKAAPKKKATPKK